MKFNPVLEKELKVKMRNWKIVWMIGAYLLVLTLVAVFIVVNALRDMSSSFNRNTYTAVYGYLAAIQFLLIAFIAPALTSGSISGERERQTIDLLLCTKLPPRSIILGKLLSSISQIILLIIASLPVVSIVFIFGGLSMKNISQLLLFYLVMAILMGSIGIFFSTFIKKTTTSNVVTYGFVLFLLFGTIFLAVFYAQIFRSNMAQVNPNPTVPPKTAIFPLLYGNPLFGFASLLMDQLGGNSGYLPIIGNIGTSSNNIFDPWKINLAVNSLLSLVLLTLSSFKINPVRKLSIKKASKSKTVKTVDTK